jgi:uncharacterized protein YutE (UPF0331/DUF86 family)
MLSVQTCADIASHLIADEGWAAAPSLGVAFERLRDQGVISAPACAALAGPWGCAMWSLTATRARSRR